MSSRSRLAPPGPDNRRGAAVVELAVCLPVILILLLSGIECTSMIFTKQALHVVAYEGARLAIEPDVTTGEVLARCNQIIAERNLQGTQVNLTPANIDGLQRGTPIQIEVTGSADANRVMRLQFFNGSTLQASASMIKE